MSVTLEREKTIVLEPSPMAEESILIPEFAREGNLIHSVQNSHSSEIPAMKLSTAWKLVKATLHGHGHAITERIEL